MKSKILTSCNKIIAFLLAFLGFANACNNFAKEYGVPHADFIVKGSVVSAKDNKAIKNIRLIMRDSSVHYNYDTTYSDVNGNYSVKMTGFPGTQTAKIDLQDIDGLANGEFQPLDTVVEFKNPQFSGGDGSWYDGKTENELNITLKPKP